MKKFEEVYAINVNEKTERKGNLTYLSWAYAWAEFKKVYPGATYKINPFDGTYCTGNEKMGYMVQTQVTAEEQTYEMWLPVMDHKNNAILQPKMTEINKTIMRCLTKNLAMFGLGLYIYAGEDLPEGDGDNGDNGENKNKDGRCEKNAEKKPSSTPKTQDKDKYGERITKAEMVEKYGVKNVEQMIAWLENKMGVSFKEWTADDAKEVRAFLSAQKAKREAEAAKYREELKNAGTELPFE